VRGGYSLLWIDSSEDRRQILLVAPGLIDATIVMSQVSSINSIWFNPNDLWIAMSV
jgi:hypothetical protein